MTGPAYPNAPRPEFVEDLHGRRVADPYRWLEDPSNDGTQRWSAAQDVLFAATREQWPGREALRRRLNGLQGAGVISVPVWRGERCFFMRRTGEQEHAVLHTTDPDGTERVLLDPMAIDASGTTTLDAWQPSKEGHLLAYQLSEKGTEESVVRVLDVVTGEVLDGPIDRTRYSPIAWLPGGKAYFYVRRLAPEGLPEGDEQFHRRIWLHRIGADPDEDVLVFGEGLDKTNYYGVSVSMDGRWLTVSAAAGTAPRNDIWLADLQATGPEQPELRVVQHGVDAHTALRVSRD
ncbi:MAG: prolyl oligopeptidase family serine peptidase, partial [Streptomycetales bacterium]